MMTTCILPYSGLSSQIQSGISPSSVLDIEVFETADPYSMRLDFMTESQVDDIIELRKITLDDLCDKTMGCKSRTSIVLSVGDKIQLFNDDRISKVELIQIKSGKKFIIASSVTTKKESYIVVTQEITRDNIENFMLQII